MNSKAYQIDTNSKEFRDYLENQYRLRKSRKDLEEIKVLKAVYPPGNEFWSTPETRLKVDLMFHYPKDIPHDLLNISWPDFKNCRRFRLLAKVCGAKKFINVLWKQEQIEQFLYDFGGDQIVWYAIEALLDDGIFRFVKFWDKHTSKKDYDKLE